MAEEKRYWWIRLKTDFFDRGDIRRLERQGGDRSTIIYLKLLLSTVKTGGLLKIQGASLDDRDEELATTICEETENVKKVLPILKRLELMSEPDETCLFFREVAELFGNEGASAARTREYEKRKKLKEKQKILNNNKSLSEFDLNLSESDAEASKTHGELEEYLEEYLEEPYKKENLEKKKATEKTASTKKSAEEKPERPISVSEQDKVEIIEPLSTLPPLPLADGSQYIIPETFLQELERAYPEIDIEAETRKMVVWLDANPTKRKKPKGIKRFITNWLSHSQTSAPLQASQPKPKKAPSFFEMAMASIDDTQKAGEPEEYFL